MSLTLFGHKNCKGSSVQINRNYSDLKDTSLNYRASSARLSSSGDTAIFYKETSYRGEAMFRSGNKTIENLGDPGDGGKNGFNNKVKSVRITPYRMKVKYHFMYKEGELPGDHDGVLGMLTIAQHINELHEVAAEIWEPYMVELEKETLLGFYNSSKYFEVDLTTGEEVQLQSDPIAEFANWRVDVVFVEDVISQKEKDNPGTNTTGWGGSPITDPMVILELRPESLTFTNGRAIAHEIGHICGLGHGSNDNPNRLMTQAGQISSSLTDAVKLSQSEAETVHTELANNDVSRPLLRLE
ncbi:MAG: hypothetical protein ACR2QK_01455 [Acidimicrobiales bacterium]